jgi:allantoinase
MTSLDLLIRAPRAILPDSERAVSIGVAGGRIVRVAAFDAPAAAGETVTLDDDTVLLPGLVDSHVHICAGLGSIFIVHAESAETSSRMPTVSTRRYADYLASRPKGIENLSIAEVIEAACATGARTHILHLSSADALPMIASAIEDGVRLSVETCPHYLALCAEEIGDGETAAKVGPPIREASNREKLWAGIAEGTLSMIVSDHSPCTPDMKGPDSGDFGAAWGGISSLQLGLPVVWSEARRRGHSLADVISWMAERPAALAGLSHKGKLAVGGDADFAVFSPDEEFTVDPARLHHRHPVTPYAGKTLTGVVRETFLRGRRIEPSGRPRGALIARDGVAAGETQDLKRSA